jgi:NADP-reducing hydrogenase subunit HndD
MNIKINGMDYEVDPGLSILAAAMNVGISIPSLCYSKSVGVIASCRACVVEVKGSRGLVTACNTIVSDGMEITTNSERVLQARKTVLELLLSDHELNCLKCKRSFDCRLKLVSEDAQCNPDHFERNKKFIEVDKSNSYIKRNPNKCIMCGRCVRVCAGAQQVGVLSVNDRGFNAHIGCAFDKSMETVPCVTCGQCVVNCPTGALCEVDQLDLLKEKLNDPDVHVVIATAPSVRVSMGEGFNMRTGENVAGKIVSAMKLVGFDKVFDLDLGADFTIMEESTEFLKRLESGGKLPMLTSCCPGWVNYAQMYHPDLLENVSTTKSPMQIFGALVKSYYAREVDIDPKKIFTVMLMPCIAKQSESQRHGIDSSTEYKDIDLTITVRQAIKLVKENRITFAKLPDTEFDNPLGISTGAGLIFGTTGGVMEAALRTVSEKLLGKRLENIEFQQVRGEKAMKVAELELGEHKIKVAVVSGLNNAEKILKRVKNGQDNYHFIEVMACCGGCVNGGGQPVHSGWIQNNFANAVKRARTLYSMDQYNNYRRSHENPIIKEIYEKFLGEPNSQLAHELLHTHYKPRKKYNK